MKTLSIEELLKENTALKRLVAELQARFSALEKQGKKNSRNSSKPRAI